MLKPQRPLMQDQSPGDSYFLTLFNFVIKDFIYEKKNGHTLCVCALPRCYYSLHPSVILSAAAAQVQFGRPSLSILLKRCTPTL